MSKLTQSDPSTIQIGVETMLSGVREIPNHLMIGADLARSVKGRFDSVSRVTLCALGGSAFPGELLRVMGIEYDLPFSISRSYQVNRSRLTAHDLVIVSSFSGNTEETLSALRDAMSRGAQVLLICAGGELKRIAEERDLPLITITRPSASFQPRAASGFLLGILAGVLEDLDYLPAARTRIKQISQELVACQDVEEEASAIADALEGHVPVFYAPPPYAESLARIVKIKINENAKSPAFWNEIPEFNHNEMVGYSRLHSPFIGVFFLDPHASSRMRQRIEQSVATLKRYQVKTLTVPIRPLLDPLSSVLATLYLFDVVSCMLAMRAGVDPNPVMMIEEFKVELGPQQADA